LASPRPGDVGGSSGSLQPSVPTSFSPPAAFPSTVTKMTTSESKEQESYLLERGVGGSSSDLLSDSESRHVQLVSLGCMCGPKLSFQLLGRGAETLPFDWLRTRLEGILHFMRTEFRDFFEYVTVKEKFNGNMTMYRSKYHAFWHDNPNEESMREKYHRRIERFNSINATDQPVLFVRAVNSTDEILLAQELLAELTSRFGFKVHLLLVIDFQLKMHGPAMVEGVSGNLLLYYHRNEDRVPGHAPYLMPVKVGLDWATGKPIHAIHFESLQAALAAANETHWGYNAVPGIPAFENFAEDRPRIEQANQLLRTQGNQSEQQQKQVYYQQPHLKNPDQQQQLELECERQHNYQEELATHPPQQVLIHSQHQEQQLHAEQHLYVQKQQVWKRSQSPMRQNYPLMRSQQALQQQAQQLQFYQQQRLQQKQHQQLQQQHQQHYQFHQQQVLQAGQHQQSLDNPRGQHCYSEARLDQQDAREEKQQSAKLDEMHLRAHQLAQQFHTLQGCNLQHGLPQCQKSLLETLHGSPTNALYGQTDGAYGFMQPMPIFARVAV